MASQSETGHTKNLVAFQQGISYCKGYGAAYNPGNTALSTANLDLQFAAAQTLLDDWKAKYVAKAVAVDERTLAFSTLRALSTRILSAMIAVGADQQTLETAKSFNRKIQGQRASKPQSPPDPNLPPPQNISSAQTSYDNLVEHLKGLVGLVATLPAYQPNEAEMKLSGLQAHIELLKVKNFAILQAETDLHTARLARDHAFYDLPNSLANSLTMMKAYVKSIFGGESNEYKQIRSIRFKRR